MENTCLLDFLRKLTHDIETNKLDTEQLTSVSEFYMTYQFHKENKIEDQSEDFDKDELLKFIVLGWYIYKMIKI